MMSQEQLKPDLSGFDAFDVLKQGRKAIATQPEPTVAPSIHEQDAKAYKSILDEARAALGLSDGDSLVAAIERLATQPEQAKGGEPMTPEQRGVAAEYWGSLTQQKADLDTRRGVSMPVSYYASDVVAAALAHYATPATAASVSDEREAFEAEMRCKDVWGHRSLVKRPDGRYQNWQVDAMWDVWQARAALRPDQAGVPDDIVKDAQRYRWLRKSLPSGQGSLTVTLDDRCNGCFNKPVFMDSLDAAIDAAMRAAAPNKETAA